MSWVKINAGSRRNFKEESVRVAFQHCFNNVRDKNYLALRIVVPDKIFEEMDIDTSSYVSVSHSEDDKSVLLISKNINDSDRKSSYKVRKHTRFSCIVQLSWNLFVPNKNEFKTHKIKYEICQDGLKLFLRKK